MIKTHYLSTCVPTHKVIQNKNKYIAHNKVISKFGEISFQEYVSEEKANLVLYGDLVYDLGGTKAQRISSRRARK